MNWDNKPILAVLPFEHQPGGLLEPHLVGGFCDDITTCLAKFDDLLVIPRQSTSGVILEETSPVRIGASLNADLVLVGTMHEFGDDIRLYVNLVEVGTSLTVWAERYNFRRRQLARAPGRVTNSIARFLQGKLASRKDDDLSQRTPGSGHAYELYLRAIDMLPSNQEAEIEIALGMLDRAIEYDPGMATVHAARGYALWRKYFSGWDADVRTLDDALQSVRTALHLDSSCVAAKMTTVRIYWDLGRHEDALAEGISVLRMNPFDLESALVAARAYNNAGLADLALPLTLQVLAVDRVNPTALKLAVWNYLMVGDYNGACNTGQRWVSRNPVDSNTRWAVAMAYARQQNWLAAIDAAEVGLRSDPTDVTLWVLLGYIHRSKGDEGAARRSWSRGAERVSARFEDFPSNRRVHAWLANLYAALGQVDKATAAVQRLRAADPNNSYLLYRIGHVAAELEDYDLACETFSAATDNGFLSVQIMRHEENICATKKMASLRRYQEIVGHLEQKVEELRSRYRRPLEN